ncbi:MAG: aminotransferase class I/II-fold pyridoxal phosphate-dependent enzyme, partial [Candidatus Poribacteria bacterium]|nr:aminotransferase class I/II-fold pyridoxal phosphate-dependent enzyme [Candidatus Poribacteria bacterium]
YLYEALERLGLEYVETEGNFILVQLGRSGQDTADALMRKGVIVRPMAAYGFPDAVRVTIGKLDENRRFITSLREVLN